MIMRTSVQAALSVAPCLSVRPAPPISRNREAVEISNLVETQQWTSVNREQIRGQKSKVTGNANVKTKKRFRAYLREKWVETNYDRRQLNAVQMVKRDDMSVTKVLQVTNVLCKYFKIQLNDHFGLGLT